MGPLTRLYDWQPRLHAWLHLINGRVIEPGQHDCCLFGAGAVEAQTGIDLAAPWRGRYRTMAGGARILRRAGYADHVALIEAALPRIAVSQAREGDLAIVTGVDGPAVGVMQGCAIYVLAETGNLGFAAISPGLIMFKVG